MYFSFPLIQTSYFKIHTLIAKINELFIKKETAGIEFIRPMLLGKSEPVSDDSYLLEWKEDRWHPFRVGAYP